jgi:nickel-dependent lactate racemase
MRVELNYGRGKLPVELADELDVTIVRKPVMPVLPDPEDAVRQALARPVGAPSLAELVRGRKTACILICDITRPVPNGVFLPIMIRQLLDAGMAADAITVLVATGLHRPNEGAELEELVGSSWVMETVRVENHFARDDAAHVDLGADDRRIIGRADGHRAHAGIGEDPPRAEYSVASGERLREAADSVPTHLGA